MTSVSLWAKRNVKKTKAPANKTFPTVYVTKMKHSHMCEWEEIEAHSAYKGLKPIYGAKVN